MPSCDSARYDSVCRNTLLTAGCETFNPRAAALMEPLA
jgi:hypothetical protein